MHSPLQIQSPTLAREEEEDSFAEQMFLTTLRVEKPKKKGLIHFINHPHCTPLCKYKAQR